MSEIKVLYFGCKKGAGRHTEAGHYLCGPGLYDVEYSERRKICPWTPETIDAKLAPKDARKNELPQGQALVHRKNGWMAISFWDRSGDQRGNSNSTFLINRETMFFDQALKEAEKVFPELFERFRNAGIEIVEVKQPVPPPAVR